MTTMIKEDYHNNDVEKNPYNYNYDDDDYGRTMLSNERNEEDDDGPAKYDEKADISQMVDMDDNDDDVE